ncbi:MAG: lysylphosphatidylglycerol synthase transmembrane domain-containing protein [Phycisphaerales bacterium]
MPNAHNAGKKGHFSWIARIAVASAAILWLLHGQDWGKLAVVFHSLNLGYFCLSLAVYALAQVVISVRWWLLLRAQSIHIGVLAAVRLFFLGLFYSNIMPGSVGGDLVKAWYVTKHTNKRLEGVLSVFLDRVIGLIGLILMAVLTYMISLRGHITALFRAKEGGAGWFSQHPQAILGVATITVILLAASLVHPASRTALARWVAVIRLRGFFLLRRAKDAVVTYCTRPWILLGTVVLTFIGQSIVIVAFWLLGRDLGIDVGLRYYLFVFPVMWVVGAVPISIAGLGIVEAGTVGLFCRLTGAPVEQALALVFCQRFIWILASLPGGLIHLLGAHLPREDISVDCGGTGN